MLEDSSIVEVSFMPELPEVEVVRRGLEKATLTADGAKICGWVFHRKDLRYPIPKKMLERLKGAVIRKISRRAKYLLFETDRGIIVSHLGMTGKWQVHAGSTSPQLEKHSHVELHLEKSVLVFSDPRRFGVLDFIDKDLDRHVRFAHLGPEPLEDLFSGEYLFAKLRGKAATIKVLLMDQKIVVGVGNIYASEVLFRAGISPLTRGAKISKSQANSIAQIVKEVLLEAIDHGGSSISDYIQVDGVQGTHQDHFFVYDRKGELCRICHTRIKAAVMGGRSTFWCPSCQSPKKKIDQSPK